MPGNNSDRGSSEGIRINKYLSGSGSCSRRGADKLISEGRVVINGTVAELGSVVFPGDVVELDGKKVLPHSDDIYLAFYKPLGVTCTTDTRDPSNIIDYIGYPERIFPVGRLDKNSSGLILLTNNGDIVNTLLRAENNHEKEYIVSVDKPLAADFAERMSSGLPILGQTTLPCEVEILGSRRFRIVLHQGLNRQIRRMCEYLGYRVVKLRRVRFMNIVLGSMKVGEVRRLTSEEVRGLTGNK
ncbi:23S rRNA pseudouridine2604 synthase [Ruminococcaceae bacterium YRB3002]|nr:23S rRNA pseudouridine2604 synthase [Ruminococcaceae bacterium YRB3002]